MRGLGPRIHLLRKRDGIAPERACHRSRSPGRWQKRFGVELAHVRLFRKRLHLHERLAQHRKRLGIEPAGVREHRHELVIDAVRGLGVGAHDVLGDLDGLVAVRAHEGDGLKPALEKTAQRLRLAGDGLVGREDHVDMEVLDQLAEAQQHLAFAALNEIERLREIDDGAVDRPGLERGDPVGVVADRDLRHPVVTPSLLPRHFADDPARDRADRRYADLAAPQVIERCHRGVIAHDQREQQRRPGHGGNAFHRRSLHDEGQPRSGAEPDIDAVGRHRLLQPGIAAETADLDVDAVLPEDAGARADVGGHEGECVASRLPHAQRLGRGGDDATADKTAETTSNAPALRRAHPFAASGRRPRPVIAAIIPSPLASRFPELILAHSLRVRLGLPRVQARIGSCCGRLSP